jgi:multidrug efflux pump subunit AcrA (membrane-fusion protein)
VWVQAPNPEQQLRPGTTAQVSITAQNVHDALVVPAVALINAKDDSAQVMVVDSQNQAQSRDVKVGITTPAQAQILSGLKPGEVVVTQGAYGLPDKTKVKIEKPKSAEAEGQSGDKKDKDDDAKSNKGPDKPKPAKKDAAKDKDKD